MNKDKIRKTALKILMFLLLFLAICKLLVFYRFQWYGADQVIRGEIYLPAGEKGVTREMTEAEMGSVISVLKVISAAPCLPDFGLNGVPGNLYLYGKHSTWNFVIAGDKIYLNFIPYKIPEKYREQLSSISPYKIFPYEDWESYAGE